MHVLGQRVVPRRQMASPTTVCLHLFHQLDMDRQLELVSITDFSSFSLQEELLFGKLRSTTEFHLAEIIGDGSSALVFRGRDPKHDRDVALKQFRRTPNGPIFPKEVFREITILKSLDHVNVIKLYDIMIGTNIDELGLVLEFCPHSLDQYIDSQAKTGISHAQIKCVAKQMFKGLNYLHKNFVIHRDLKPTNLMISAGGILKIGDFGLSKRYVRANMTMTPDVITRWYQPPEILLECTNYNLGVDLWSAGCIFAELFMGTPIFPGESQMNQINLIINLIGSPSPNVWPDYPKCPALKKISLKKQPFNRLGEKFSKIECSRIGEMVSNLLVYDPDKRMSAEDFLADDWFDSAPFPSERIEFPKTALTGQLNQNNTLRKSIDNK